jgi:tRNA pseudouridine32 synthase / 23S rRNA pseudouridine746 synthase
MDILYVDSFLLAVNKPAGLSTIPGGWDGDSTSLVELLEPDFGRLWVVHRLDKVTSGVVIFARDAGSHRELNMLFEHHQAHKLYHAITVGTPPWDDHIARHPLRIDQGHRHRTVVDHGQGKPSETAFHVMERFDGYALLSVIPATGRTHQVRAHASALGFPLLGDTLYRAPQTSLIQRPALHAWSLEFDFGGKLLLLSAPYPSDFIEALNKLRAGH